MTESTAAATRRDVRRRTGRAPRVTVRPYRRQDDAGLAAVCLATAAPDGRDGTARYAHPGLPADVYALPYVRFEPDLCLVVDDGTREGRVSGYVLGTSDTVAFEEWATRAWWPGVRRRYPVEAQVTGTDDARLAAVAGSPVATSRALTDRYPAHLHVDLLPHVQGQGLGRRLVEAFMVTAHTGGASGAHLGVSTANERAVGFYGRLGFHLVERTDDALMLGRLLP